MKFSTFLLLALFATFARAQEVENQRDFSYDERSENGPSKWGKIRREWRVCNSGKMQSPIDLLDKRVKVVSSLGKLKTDYKPTNATLINRGHDMMVRWTSDAGHIKINGTLFHLKQIHWHEPSEHTFNGKKFDMESHMVHQSDNNRTAVVAIVYKIGQPNSFLSMLKNDFEALVNTTGVEKPIGVVNPGDVKFEGIKYYRYIGSLTTPPCTEDVIWTILENVSTVAREQVQLIRKAVREEYDKNARPTQATNGRLVEKFVPKDIPRKLKLINSVLRN